jgi:hypothetical protein
MAKHVTELTLAELAEAGAAAAQQAAARAHAAGLPPAGTVEYFEPAAAASDDKRPARRVAPRAPSRRVSR